MPEQRTEGGRFAAGNAGGPGRPRRAVESQYMASIGDVVTVEDWQAIVRRALDDAKNGDAKAREWLTKYLVGTEPPTLVSIAATEERVANGFEEVEDEITREAAKQRWKQRDDEQWRETRAVLDAIKGRLPK